MATHDKPIPAKLTHDAIVEAVFEIRFDTATIPEIFFGRLADYAPWKGFKQQRLPAYEIPAPMRQADLNLRYQPVFALLGSDGHRAVRIGAQVLSYHQSAPYAGWKAFRRELGEAIEGLFAKVEGPTIRRLGLRYLNALRPDVHGIGSISALDLELTIASQTISGKVNVNFTTELSDDTQCTVRVATTDFVQGDLPPGTSVFVDVDVFTKDAFRANDDATVTKWLEFAHTKEKEQFFRLLTDETIDALKED